MLNPDRDAVADPPGLQLVRWASLGFGLELLVWFSGAGGRDLHLAVLPLWLVPALLALARRRSRAGAWQALQGVADRLDRLPAGVVLGGMLALAGTGWAVAYTLRYLDFGFKSYDLGIYSSIAYNSAHGHLFFSSVQQVNHLGEHFSPVMALYAPLYRLWPHPAWLLGTLLATYLVVPLLLYRISLALFAGRRPRALAFAAAALWLLNAAMAGAVNFAFHPSTLTAPLILLAFLLAERRRWFWLVVTLAGLLLFKENLALVMVGFGLYLACERRTRAGGIALAVAGAAAGWLLVFQVIPAFRGGDWAYHMSRLGPLADPLPKLRYVLVLLGSVGFLPVLRLRTALLFGPALALNLATSFPNQYGMACHYDDTVVPLLFAGALVVLQDLHKRLLFRRYPERAWSILLVLVLVTTSIQLGRSPLRVAREHRPSAAAAAVRAELAQVQAGLDADRMVYLQDNLVAHVQRLAKTKLRPGRLGRLRPGSLVVLAPEVSLQPAAEQERLHELLASRPDVFTRVPGFTHLVVYRVASEHSPLDGSIGSMGGSG